MRKKAYSTICLLLILVLSSTAQRYNFDITIDGFENIIDGTVKVNFLAYSNDPTEDKRRQESFVVGTNPLTYDNIKLRSDHHNQVVFTCELYDSKGNLQNSNVVSFPLSTLQENPARNTVPLSIFKKTSDVTEGRSTIQTAKWFADYLKDLVINRASAPLVGDKVREDTEYPLGTLLFYNDNTQSSSRYNLPVDINNVEKISLAQFSQSNFIKTTNEFGASVDLDLKGVYASISADFKNSKFIEYTLEIEGKQRQYDSLNNEVYRLLKEEDHPFVKLMVDQINNSPSGERGNFRLLGVTSQFWIDSIYLENKNFKEIGSTFGLSVDAYEFLELSASNKLFINKGYKTSFSGKEFYMAYEITDYSVAIEATALLQLESDQADMIRNLKVLFEQERKRDSTNIRTTIRSLGNLVAGSTGDSTNPLVSLVNLEFIPQLDIVSAMKEEKLNFFTNHVFAPSLIKALVQYAESYKSHDNVLKSIAVIEIGDLTKDQFTQSVEQVKNVEEFRVNFSSAISAN